MMHPWHLHGMPMKVVARDGYPLAQPVPCDTLGVNPGERWDVIIDCEDPGAWAFHCHILPHAEGPDGMFGMVTALVIQDATAAATGAELTGSRWSDPHGRSRSRIDELRLSGPRVGQLKQRTVRRPTRSGASTHHLNLVGMARRWRKFEVVDMLMTLVAARRSPAAGLANHRRQKGPRMTVGSHRSGVVVPLSSLVALFTLAELSDLVTAQMVRRELNPIAASLSATPLLSFALKIALIAFVVATAVICERERPGLARLVLVIGTIAGVVGALSNTHLTPI